MFEHKKIFILGMARSGYAAAKTLAKRNNEIVLNDFSNDQDQDKVNELRGLGVNVILGSHPEDLLTSDFDYFIKNQSISNDHFYVKKAIEYGIPVMNEAEMAYHLLPKETFIIGITGSNGKTTTTTIIYEILKKAERKVHLTGNIGFPLSGFVDKVNKDDLIVMEIADHQLVNFTDFKTNISVMTNLSEVHIDFHGSYENYLAAKKKIFDHHTSKDLAILNFENADVMKLTKDIKSRKIYFSSKQKCDGAYILDNYIYYYDQKIISLNDIRLSGVHNYENMMCAIAVAIEVGTPINIIKEVLTDFAGVEHRLEYVRKINDIEIYNDSKSTNNQATEIALASFTKPIILLLGGLDRGQSFDELSSSLTHVRYIICYGETKNNIKMFADKYQKECFVVDNLEEATKAAFQLANPGDVILFSPACASWDQYKSFEERGHCFKKYVEELK